MIYTKFMRNNIWNMQMKINKVDNVIYRYGGMYENKNITERRKR